LGKQFAQLIRIFRDDNSQEGNSVTTIDEMLVRRLLTPA
jgi:hypothetical protein